MKYKPKQIGLRHIDWVGLIVSTDLPAFSKLIAYQLSSYMNKHQAIAWPSQSRLMAECSISNGALNKHLKLLESEGWITRNSGNHSTNTRYIITLPKIIEKGLATTNKELQTPPNGVGTPRDGVGTPPNGVGVLHEVETNISSNISVKDIAPPKVGTCDHQKTGESPNSVPFEKIKNLYHQKLPELPQVKILTKTRKGYIRQRWLDELPDLETWANYFDFVRRSSFLMGKTSGNGDRPPFRADLEWLCRPTNFVKVYEGKYHES